MAPSSTTLPSGYRWQADVDRESGITERNPYSFKSMVTTTTSCTTKSTTTTVKTPNVEVGSTLVFQMDVPPDWDEIDDAGKWRRKREHLSKRYGELCFDFLEDPDECRPQLGRIAVEPRNYYALFEVWDSEHSGTQFHATMTLLEKGLAIGMDDYATLRRSVGMPSAEQTRIAYKNKLTRSASKRTFDDIASDPPIPRSPVDYPAQSLNQRVRLQESGIRREPQPIPKPAIRSHHVGNAMNPTRTVAVQQPNLKSVRRPQLIPALPPVVMFAPSDGPKVFNCLFPSNLMETTVSRAQGRAGLGSPGPIRNSPYLKKLQLLPQIPRPNPARPVRLCSQYGQAQHHAIRVLQEHRRVIHTAFTGETVRSCTRLANLGRYDIDKVLDVIASYLRCAEDEMLTCSEYANGSNALKCAHVHYAFFRSYISQQRESVGEKAWAQMYGTEIAKMEMHQRTQDQTWLNLRNLVRKLELNMTAGSLKKGVHAA